MAEISARPDIVASSPGAWSTMPRWGRLGAAMIVGLGVAIAADRTTTGTAYRARALVGIEDAVTGAAIPLASLPSTSDVALAKTVLARAAVSLRDRGIAADQPGLVERLAVAADVAGATSQDDRMSRLIGSSVSIAAEPALEGLTVLASDQRPERAAAIATTVAEAYVAEKNAAFLAARRDADAVAASHLQTLMDANEIARRRLAGFGADRVDPAAARGQALSATSSAKARLDAFRAVLASGTPPLGASVGLPVTIAPLQTAYLDLKRQLLDAQRTMGERHTAVIALEDGVRQAAKMLTAEWKQLTRAAETDWSAARDREEALGKAETASDPKTRIAIDEAREALRASDSAIRRFRAGLDAPSRDVRFRIVTPAAVPTGTEGMPEGLRIGLVLLLGLLSAWLVMPSRPRLKRGRPAAIAPEGMDAAESALAPKSKTKPSKHDADAKEPARLPFRFREPRRPLEAANPPRTSRGPHTARVKDPMPTVASQPLLSKPVAPKPVAPKPVSSKSVSSKSVSSKSVAPMPWPVSPSPALSEIVSTLDLLVPKAGLPRLVVVGSLETPSTTAPVVLALARAASDAGRRVLLLEGARPNPRLASAVDHAASPLLVDILGTLRIAFPAEGNAALIIAPYLPDAKRMIAGLSRRDDVAFIDDAESAFDVVIVDGGHIHADTAEDWSEIAVASLRVGGHGVLGDQVSRDEDALFLDAIGARTETFLGTIGISASTRYDLYRPTQKHDARPEASPDSDRAATSNVTRPVFAVHNAAAREEAARLAEAGGRPSARRRIGTR